MIENLQNLVFGFQSIFTLNNILMTFVGGFLGIIVGAMTNPKGLVKTGIVVLVAAVIVAGAYFLAPGSEPVGYNGVPETYGWLKLTDTMLNLTYLSCVAAVLSVIVGAIVSAVRK